MKPTWKNIATFRNLMDKELRALREARAAKEGLKGALPSATLGERSVAYARVRYPRLAKATGMRTVQHSNLVEHIGRRHPGSVGPLMRPFISGGAFTANPRHSAAFRSGLQAKAKNDLFGALLSPLDYVADYQAAKPVNARRVRIMLSNKAATKGIAVHELFHAAEIKRKPREFWSGNSQLLPYLSRPTEVRAYNFQLSKLPEHAGYHAMRAGLAAKEHPIRAAAIGAGIAGGGVAVSAKLRRKKMHPRFA